MKILISLIIILLLAVIFYPRDYQFPYEVEITDRQGRTIEVILLERTPTHVRFHHKGHSSDYHYEIEKLSDESLRLIKRFPVSDGGKDP